MVMPNQHVLLHLT